MYLIKKFEGKKSFDLNVISNFSRAYWYTYRNVLFL